MARRGNLLTLRIFACELAAAPLRRPGHLQSACYNEQTLPDSAISPANGTSWAKLMQQDDISTALLSHAGCCEPLPPDIMRLYTPMQAFFFFCTLDYDHFLLACLASESRSTGCKSKAMSHNLGKLSNKSSYEVCTHWPRNGAYLRHTWSAGTLTAEFAQAFHREVRRSKPAEPQDEQTEARHPPVPFIAPPCPCR